MMRDAWNAFDDRGEGSGQGQPQRRVDSHDHGKQEGHDLDSGAGDAPTHASHAAQVHNTGGDEGHETLDIVVNGH